MILERKTRNTSAKAWLERVNPLQGLSITQAKSVFDVARAHGSPLLQKIYEEIELTDPVLMTCVERRQSALAGLGWRAVANASATDPEKAEAQRTALEEFANGIDNLDEAVEHLDLAFFRGFSVVQPVWAGSVVRHVNLLDSWNFLRGDDGRLMWNPNCSLDPRECDEITPSARTVQIVRRRAIDWPALIIYIRSYLGERDWGRFIERYGIPPVDAVMAPNATDKQLDEYLECAEAAKDGRAVAWPSGSTVSRAEGCRGTDPFSAFIEHQEKLTVLMATGGTLTSLAQADTGSLAGGAQMDVWEQIVKRDGVVISGALNRQLFAPFLEMRFPGEPVMAHFEIGKEDEMSATEAADLAVKVKGAGYLVDQSQLEESVGFKLEKAPEASPQDGLNAPFMTNKAGREGTPRTDKDETPLENAATAIENAPRKPDGQGDGSGLQALLGAFSRDLGPAAEEVRKLLEDLEAGKDVKDAAKALLEKLPDLLPDDPAMAAIIAEEMAKVFGEAKGGAGREGTPRTEGEVNEITQEEAERIYEEMMSK